MRVISEETGHYKNALRNFDPTSSVLTHMYALGNPPLGSPESVKREVIFLRASEDFTL